jgi:hypothetical protein
MTKYCAIFAAPGITQVKDLFKDLADAYTECANGYFADADGQATRKALCNELKTIYLKNETTYTRLVTSHAKNVVEAANTKLRDADKLEQPLLDKLTVAGAKCRAADAVIDMSSAKLVALTADLAAAQAKWR